MPVNFSAPTASPANEYLRNRVLTATPEELRLMLLDGAIKFGRQGREGLARKDFEAVYTGLTACRDIVTELLTSVRPEPNPELATRVRSLYAFIYTLLVEGGLDKDVAKLDQAIELLEYERETWALLMQKVTEERGRAADSAQPASLSLQA
jgi:flagellar protein FliS